MADVRLIKLLLAEDNLLTRYTLCSVLRNYSDIEIVGEATDGREAVLKAEQLQPEIVLIDVSMPKLDGIEATRQIKANSPRMAVIGLSVHTDCYFIDAMLKAGAVEVLQKEQAWRSCTLLYSEH
jgi:DNA-binding NarL/FixJ family response regulator